MKHRILFGVAATIVALGTSGIAPVFAASNLESYTISQGDTLYKISVSEGVSLAALEAANPQIANFANIYLGEVVNLPLTAYTVLAGDSLYKISVAEGQPLSAIEAVNPQIANFAEIMPGQMINIPVSATAATPATTSATTSTTSSAVTPSTSSVATERQNIVNYAETLIGTPYAWGGDTPSVGFDCSGFVEYVFDHFGITLPRESHDQANVGTPVAQNALQPGDLLFFKDTDSSASLYANQVTHVGIYIGNGAMIESSSLNNMGVTIVQNVFSNPYYVAHYYGATDVIG